MTSDLATAHGPDQFADRMQPYLGIVTTPVADSHEIRAGVPDRGGLVITHVSARSPAAKAGLAVDDVVLEFDARAVTTSDELQRMVEAAGKGTQVKLGILRKGERREIEVVIGVEPARGTDGAEVHSGPLDVDADFEKVPAAWRQKVRDLDTRARDAAKPRDRRAEPPAPQPKP